MRIAHVRISPASKTEATIEIEHDEAKRLKILAERGLDLRDDPPEVFAAKHIEAEDNRKDYGELRYQVWGFLRGRRVSLDSAWRCAPDHHNEICP